MKYWLIAVTMITLLVFALSSVWYNNLVKQFLTEKSLDAQKQRLTEQAALLTEQNQVIEQDKALLANQLETSQRQLNAFALRLAKSANFLENIKSAIASINTLETEDAAKKKRLLRQIDQENDRENDWIHFREQFEQVHPNFFPALLAEFPTLSASDMRLLSLIKMNLETKEIADILSISPQSLNTARYRLRKNLGLTTEGLSEFVQKIR